MWKLCRWHLAALGAYLLPNIWLVNFLAVSLFDHVSDCSFLLHLPALASISWTSSSALLPSAQLNSIQLLFYLAPTSVGITARTTNINISTTTEAKTSIQLVLPSHHITHTSVVAPYPVLTSPNKERKEKAGPEVELEVGNIPVKSS